MGVMEASNSGGGWRRERCGENNGGGRLTMDGENDKNKRQGMAMPWRHLQ
ncbi:angiopoietin-related protein 3 [Sesbania bispinosa]|nr:angiopoietin-related protein 3 [Sesbania bispinosa]